MALLPGVGKLFGSVGSKLTNEQAKAIASQTLGRTLTDYAAKTGAAMTREGITEATQQALERLQAGLEITDPEARKEYAESFIGGAVLGGAIAPVGRAFERGSAKSQAARAEREERSALQQAEAEKARIAAEKETAEKQTPEYALRVARQLEALEQEKLGLQQQIRKITKDSTTEAEDRAFNKEINQQLQVNRRARDELAVEVNRLKQAGVYDQALEQARVEKMSPMEYMLEKTQEVPEAVAPAAADTALEEFGLEFPSPITQTARGEAADKRREQEQADFELAQITEHRNYVQERMALAREQLYEPDAAGFAEYLIEDPAQAARLLQSTSALPGLNAKQSREVRSLIKQAPEVAAYLEQRKQQLPQRTADLKAQVATTPEVPGFETEYLSQLELAETDKQAGLLRREIEEMQRLAKMPTSTVEQGDLFGEQRVGQLAGVQPVDLQAKINELNRQLQIAYVQRNADRGTQYRETISGLVEQIRDLQNRMQLPTAGQLGAKSAGLQAQLGQLPESMKAQADAAAEIEKNLYGLAQGKNEEQKQLVLENLVAGIKAVRGDLKPETITQIERQAQPILDMVARYGGEAVPGALQQLEAIGQRWRAGTERGETFTRKATPTETSADMLREQMDRAFAQRQRYDAQTLSILDQIAENFNAFNASPERRNMAGEWLNRVTQTGRSSPEMTRDVQNELARLEEAKRSETETPMRQTAFGLATKPTERAQQLELPSAVMPKAVAPQAETRVVDGKVQYVSPEDVGPLQGSPAERYTPIKKATTFATAEEFQKFLASDAVKQLRQEAGLTKDTASRMHQRMELFRKKYENIVNIARARMEVLNERRQALEKLKGQEQRAAKELLADAQIRLSNIQERLDAELQDLQIAYLEADLQASQSAADAAALSQQIADNVAKFEQADAKAVAAAQATADAKAELANIMKQPVSKKAFSAMRKAQQAVVAALREQRSASAGVPRMVSFLNEDLRLQLQLTEALEKKEADARALVEAGQILRAEAAKQKRRVLYKKEFLPAQKNLAAALELSGTELRKITGSIDAELAQVDKDIATANATARAAEEKLAPKEAPKPAFEQKLSEIKLEPLTRAEQDAITARDKAKLEAFQDTTARLAAIPGTRIDATKRRQMLDTFDAHKGQNAEIIQDIKDVDTGIEEMQIAREIATDALADDTAGYTPAQKEQFQARIKQANERIEQLNAYRKRLEAQQVSMQKAYEKAVLATSSDPEIYQKVTKDLDDRVEKLNKNIAENEERIAKGKAKSGKKAETKTLEQAQKRLASYKRELKRVEALRSNRLGIKRIDVLTGETVAGQISAEKRAEQGKAEPQKRVDIATQEQIDAENERAQLYSDRTARLLELQKAQAALEAAKEPKTAAKKAERAEKLRKLQEDINKQIDLVNEVRPKGLGKVTAAARVQSSAPGKFRTGTVESKETAGAVKQPIVEKREVAAPTVSAAAQEANDFADRLERAKDRTTLLAEAADKSLAQQAAILAAVDNNVRRYAREVDKLETERDTLQAAVDSAKEKEIQIPAITLARLSKVREQLGIYNQALTRAEAAKADVEAAQEAAPTLEGKNVSTIEGTEMGVAKSVYDIDFDEQFEAPSENLQIKQYKGVATWMVEGAERWALINIKLAIENGATTLADAIRLARKSLQNDIAQYSKETNYKFKDLVEKRRAALQALEKMRVGDFDIAQPNRQRAASIAEALPAGKNKATLSREDLTSNKVAATLETEFAEDAPFHGMTFAEAARYGAKRSSSPQVKALFEKLAEVFDSAPVYEGAGRVYAVTGAINKRFGGIYNSLNDVVYSRAPSTRYQGANKILLHELTHAATVRALQINPELSKRMEELRQRARAWLSTPEGRSYFRQHSMGLGRTPADIYALTNNREFVAELFANREFQKMLVEIPSDKPRKSIFTRFVELMAQFFNMPGKAAQSLFAEAVALTEEVFDVTRNQVYGGVTPEGGFVLEVTPYEEKAPNALTDLADKLTTKPKTLREKFSSALALEAEQAGVDMRAGLREALKAGAEGLGDTKLFTQTMYNVLKADQKMPLVYTVMSRGPLELYKDDKGFFGVRSSNKNSAVDVFAAINELPVANEKKMAVAQAYLVAQRATNKGLEKLDTGALGIKESDLQAALAAAKADPKLGTALENVRRVYNAYNKGMIDFLAATGAIPKAAAAKLNAAGDYVPFYRVNANGNASLVFDGDTMVAIGDIRRQPYLAELKGGEDRLLPLDEAIPRNTILLTDKALTNMATKAVAYGLQAIGKGAGPADPKTGKPTNKMAIHSGKGPADPGTIRFNQEPDPNDPEDTGDRWVKVDTANTLAEGVPTALLVKSLEGAHLPLPGFLKLAGAATDILRTGVTRTPLYIARQLIREPMAAAFTGGLNYNTFTAVLKANKEFVKMARGNSEAEAKLLEKGLIQSGIFTGDVDDMGKFALQLVKGDQNAFEKVFALADKAAIKADAATRALVYKNALANGLSEVEADMATMESMNFYKRGTNAAVQYFGRLIPFFNAQIQGLNVLFKAARGRMPFEEQQEIKRKFRNNAMLLTATGIVYAMAMEDDETWRNAKPRDKMSNFFIPLPGTDEMLKIPIPFEAGYFYSLAVAAVDGMREQTDNAAQWKAIRDLFLNSVPGYSSMGVPQLVKPVFEVWTNKNFLSGAPIESLRLQGLNPEERYNATTTEFAKMLSRALPVLSPIQIEHIVRGYLGVLPLAVVASANSLFEREGAGEKPEKRLSEMALVGTTFQKKYGGADADVVFEAAKDAIDARSTMNKILNEGRRQDAITFRDENRVELALAPAAGQYRQLIGRINSDLRRTQERGDLTAAEKRQRIDKLEEAKQQAANRFLELRRRTEASLGQR